MDRDRERYAAQLQKIVALGFEHVNEWADFITFLARLLKTLQAFPTFTDIPHKLLIAKRLAQCLNPALPTGVHQRALDVYVHIFSIIGPDQLRTDLPVWSSGLFPFFQYAATSVRPIVLGIYSKFYIPLQEALRPCTRAIILALLPGLEEDTGESFDKVMGLLDQISGTVSPAFFFQNLWLVLLMAPSSRAPALNYLLRRMPKLGPDDQLAPIVGDDIGLMIRAFSASLQDSQLLVQRGSLDLLVTALPLNSIGYRKDARVEDRVALMRAAIGVVLRRDLSLSRRLYVWLLGESDSSEEQLAYLQHFGLDSLTIAMQEAMRGSSEDASKAFKIFLSLLDKWEIGTPMTQRLALEITDIMRATNAAPEANEDLLLAQKTLFDALDPFIVWREFFRRVRADLYASEEAKVEAIRKVRFVLDNFRLQDEEVTRLHLPMLAFATIELLDGVCMTLQNRFSIPAQNEPGKTNALNKVTIRLAAIDEVLGFLRVAFDRMPDIIFSSQEDASEPAPILTLADGLYSANDLKSASIPEQPFSRSNLVSVITTVLRYVPRAGSLRLIAQLLERIHQPLQISWDPAAWLERHLQQDGSFPTTSDFDYLSALIRSLVFVKKAKLAPNLDIDRRAIILNLTDKLLDFLRSEHAPHLVEATELLWIVQGMSSQRHIESILCARLSSSDRSVRNTAYDAFGNLWRFTDDGELPGNLLAAPMHMLLETLKSDDLEIRRVGEAWMRCSLKSYLRVVDPILAFLLPVLEATKPSDFAVDDTTVQYSTYTKTFDAAQVHHVLENLLSLARFGGQGFTRIARSVLAAQTLDPTLQKHLQTAGFTGDTYLDAICKTLLAFLATEAPPILVTKLAGIVSQIHATTIELLQVVVSRGDLEGPMLTACQTTLLTRLLLYIRRRDLDLQNKVLHVLHAVIQALAGIQQRKNRRKSGASETADAASNALNDSSEAPIEPLLARTLCEGISKQTDNAVLHHWVDFLLMTAPNFRRSPTQLLLPLVKALTIRLDGVVAEFEGTYDPSLRGKGLSTMSTDADYTVLVNALERLVVLLAEETLHVTSMGGDNLQERAAATDMSSSSSGGGFLGYVTNVLSASESAAPVLDATPKVKPPALAAFEAVVHALLASWEISSRLEPDGEEISSRNFILSRINARARKAMERLYKTQSGETLESIVTFWHASASAAGGHDKGRCIRTLDLLGHLIASAQLICASIIERAQARIPAASNERMRLFQLNVDLSDQTLYAFLDTYLEHLEPTRAIQVWPSFQTLIRDILLNTSGFRLQLYPLLRCFTTLCERICQTAALEDRRLRRDLQDTYLKLAEAVINVVGREALEGGRARTTSAAAVSTAAGQVVQINGFDNSSEKDMAESVTLDTEKRTSARNVLPNLELVKFLAHRYLQGLRLLLMDADKNATICGTMVQQLIQPTLRNRTRILHTVPDEVFELLEELTKMASAIKAWRTLVIDCFGDARFFDAPRLTSQRWRPIINALLVADKERFLELIASVTSAKSANIFANRELETTLRQFNLRRLSFAVLSGDKNRYLTQLPMISEKLVDLMRSSVGDVVHAEVFLALRILLCRVGQQHFSGLWPVILAEMMHLFDSVRDHSNLESREYLQLILGACKFIDLLLVLQTQDFQIHQWIFVTDTVDAILPPEGFAPQAILDRLSELVGSRAKRQPSSPVLSHTALRSSASPLTSISAPQSLRKPLLNDLRAGNIKSLSDLEFFFSSISMSSYESTYALAPIDWASVEDSLDRDLFEA